MPSDNNGSDNEQDEVSSPSIDFDTFKTYYSSNSDLDNAEYYQKFPSVNPGTIRSWKAKAKAQLTEVSTQTPSTPSDPPQENDEVKRLKKDLIEALKQKSNMNEELLEGLDEDAQIKVLKNASKQTSPDPNIRLMTPSGTGKAKLGIEEYLTIDEQSFKEKGFGDVKVVIPASVLHNHEKSEALKKYK